MTYQISLYTMQCCELYMVSQTDNCESYLSSYEHIRRAHVFFVKNLLRKSYRICCVTRQESIHAVAWFPTRVYSFTKTGLLNKKAAHRHMNWQKRGVKFSILIIHRYHHQLINSLWPADAIWRHRSILAHLKAFCLTAQTIT